MQTAFGRTGDLWCGIEHYGVELDIMTFAKGIANRMPVGATVATEKIANSWIEPRISTFGGNPLPMAAMNETIGAMEQRNIPKRAARLGAKMSEFFLELKRQYEWIEDVHDMGLMQKGPMP